MLLPFTEDIPISSKELTLAHDLAGFVLAAQQTLAVDRPIFCCLVEVLRWAELGG